jgi:hypothetical protein
MEKINEDLVNWLDVFCGSREFTEIEKRKDVSPADKAKAKEEYGKVKFADEKNKKYPLDIKHIHAAISYFGMEKNYSKYSSEDRKTIAGKIARTAKKLGVNISNDWKKKHGLNPF